MFVATKNDSLLERLPVSAQQAGIKVRWQLISTTCSTRIPFTHTFCATTVPASTHLKWFRSQFVSCPLLVNPDLAK